MMHAARNADQRGGTDADGHPSFTVAQAAAQLTRAGLSWSGALGQGATVTYAFRATAPDVMPDDAGKFERLSSQQIGAVERALAAWAQVADIHFVRVGAGTFGETAYSNDATILFGGYGSGVEDAAAFASLPGSTAASAQEGDVWINQTVPYMRYPGASYEPGYLTLVHEIGHAIGLLHPGDYDGSGASYARDAAYAEDSVEYSVMSYFDLEDTGGFVRDPRWQPAGPLIDDIAAVQRLYGANTAANSGNTIYGSNGNSRFLATGTNDTTGLQSGNQPLWGTIWDAGGIDTLDFGDTTTPQRIDLRPGTFSDVQSGVGTLSIALGVTIENAVGGAAPDLITGNDAANQLFGSDGDDLLTGGRGDDLLDGGNGSDRAAIASAYALAALLVGDGGDTIVTSADGRDTLRGVETILFSDRTLATASVASADGVYRTYMGRGAASAELGYWLGQMDRGGGTGDIRAAVLADGAGHAHTLAAVDAIYVTQIGRSAGTAELSYWEGQVRAGADFATVRTAVAADPAGRAHAAVVIAESYDDYMGRDVTAGELAYWGDRIAGGMTFAAMQAALARDAYTYTHIQNQVMEAYVFGLGRPAEVPEFLYWTSQVRNTGVSLHDMRYAIANDSAAPGLSDGAVRAAYGQYMGRAPTAGELGYWNAQARSGASLDSMRDAILADPAGRTHVAQVTASLYADYFGRAPSAGEQATWLGLYDRGATPDTLAATLLTDGGARDTLHFSAVARDSVTVLPAGFAHAVVTDFHSSRNTGNSADPYGGASVPVWDWDRLDLRGTALAGVDPLASGRAHEVKELNGTISVLISDGAHHDILLSGVRLAWLASDSFLI